MPLRPENIATKQFTTALRGANRDELQAFLRKVAREHQAALTLPAQDAEARLAKLDGRLQQAEELLRSADGVYRSAQKHLRETRDRARYGPGQDQRRGGASGERP